MNKSKIMPKTQLTKKTLADWLTKATKVNERREISF